MNTQLIPVFAGEIAGTSVQLVDANLLHSFLEVVTRFNDWIKDRISEYGFVENQDFVSFTEKSVKPKGGRPSKQYHITLDMAKELSMVERNDKGKQARRYFIECEAKSLNSSPNMPIKNNYRQIKGYKKGYGNIYIIEFENGVVKVGRTKNIHQRLATHKSSLGEMSQVKNHWKSVYHLNFEDNERALIKFANGNGREIGNFNYENLVDFAERLEYFIETEDEYFIRIFNENNTHESAVDWLERARQSRQSQKTEQLTSPPEAPKTDCPKFNVPLSTWQPTNRVGATGWLTYPELARVEPQNRPISQLFAMLKREGHDINGAIVEYRSMLNMLEMYHYKLDNLKHMLNGIDQIGYPIQFN